MSYPRPPRDATPSWWQRWRAVTVGVVGGVLLTSVVTFGALLNLTNFAAGGNDYQLGMTIWLLAAVILGAGVAAPPGPARRTRVVIGGGLAVAWFALGWFTFGPPTA